MNQRQPVKKDFILADYIKIYNRYHSYITNYLRYFMNNDCYAEDIVQDIFLRLLEKRESSISDNPRAERCYLITIARNRAKDHMRRKYAEQNKYKNYIIQELELSDQFYSDIEDSYIKGELVETLYDTLESLKQKEKNVIIDKMVFDMSDSAIMKKAKITNYSLKKIEKKFAELVREKVQDYFTKH